MVGSRDERRPYSKLKIEAVSLIPGEAVLGACKTLGSGGGIGLGDISGNCLDAAPQCVADTADS